ncbi:hypothetical protein [Streptomyces sp. CB02460]|uniref:hypothetical protein n=1 Tax=Streptomyces sp. CB02460 TaxID=1703941 RepID=UPI00093F4634|nr:hypothetical protein [Streptomyces sp. CB02460]OKJ72235.1 hypothetical protein AMK30_20925 [Streptomyces sp. CB02460]
MTSSAAITLHLAAGNTIVALPSGERHRWATTALELAGFTRHQGEAHRLPLGDHVHARATLTHLHETARDCQAKVITSERPYLGDIAVVVAEALPGSWEVEVEHYPDGSIPAHLLEWVWEATPALSALSKSRIPCAAILRDGDGTELLLTERPWNDTYLVGALLPSPDHVEVVGTGAPRTVVATTAHRAAADVRSRLLPEFEQLVLLARLREVQQDLRWVRNAEAGSVDTVDLDAALERFLIHAPYLIEAARRHDGKPLAGPEDAALVRFEILFARFQADAGGQNGGEPDGIDEATALWVESAEDLVDAVRSAILGPAGKPSHSAIATATPPKPPAAVTAPGRTL